MSHQGNTMFVGVRTSDKLNDQLDASVTSMKPFFRDNNPDYLQVVRIEDDEYIGKAIENGASLERLGNVFMNVKSMLKMICPGFLMADDAIKILALTPAGRSGF